MSKEATRLSMAKIAEFVRDYPTIKKNDIQAWMSTVETPAQAMIHAAKAVPAEEREAVLRALPQIDTTDFAQAARQIQQAADSLI